MQIPIVIVCFNNYKYVKNTIHQLEQLNPQYCDNIFILNNNSTDENTIAFLNLHDTVNKYKIIHNTNIYGPRISETDNPHIYHLLPDKFILTDPDLEFHPNLPHNFIDILVELSEHQKCRKIGFALDISDFEKMYSYIYFQEKTIQDWESNFWNNKIQNNYKPAYEMYIAEIDTTLHLFNKKYSNSHDVRIAGDFTAKHLPWYIHTKLFTIYENYIFAKTQTTVSNTSKLILHHVKMNYHEITKKKEMFLIAKTTDAEELNFWTNIFPNWNVSLFDALDTYLNKNKIFINIVNDWKDSAISMYGERLSKHTYIFNVNNSANENINANITNQHLYVNAHNNKNYTLCNLKTPFNSVNSITNAFTLNNIDFNEISLIHVNIGGKNEETILEELFHIHNIFQMPIFAGKLLFPT